MTSNIKYTLPSSTGTANQVLAITKIYDDHVDLEWVTASGGSGAFSDASDPVVLNTTTKDVVVGASQINTAKLSVDGDADQVQFSIQGHSTQTNNLVTIENSAGTDVFNLGPDGRVTLGLTSGSQSWLIRDRTNALAFQGQSTGVGSIIDVFTNDSDGTDNAGVSIWAKGTPDIVANRERLFLRYDAPELAMIIESEADGTGTLRPIILRTEGNSDQLYLDTSGNVGVGVDPTEKFHVNGNAHVQGEVQLRETGGGSDYVSLVATATMTSPTLYTMPASTGTANQVLTLTKIYDDHVDLEWTTPSGSSGGGYDVEPATVTFQLDQGVSATTGTFSSELVGQSTVTVVSSLQLGNETPASATCIDVDTDRPYADKDCDGVKDAGEEYLDQAGGSTVMDEILLVPLHANLAPSNPAIIDTGSTQHRILFDSATDETVSWTNMRITGYQGGTLKADIAYSMMSATTGLVDYEVDVWAISDGDSADVDTESYDTANTITAPTVPATAGYIDVVTCTLTNKDSVADGDTISIRLRRDADDGTNDTASGDAEVRWVRVYEE
jgi:hypothetical protein